MTVVDYKEYQADLQKFLRKHGTKGWEVQTSLMDQYGVYHKEYICADGGIFYEVNGPEYAKETITVKMVTVEVEIKLFRTEYWSSDNASSKYHYEKF